MPARTVLIVEDSVEEFLLLKFACQAVNVSFCLQHVDSADLALAYLHGSQNFADKERFPDPALIILDLNMAGKSGFEVLEAVARAQPANRVPVLVFTSSMQDRD